MGPLLATLVVTVLLVGACGGSAATAEPSRVSAEPSPVSAEPSPVSAEPSRVSAEPSPVSSPSATGFTLTSTAVTPGGAIPGQFTCDGEDVSPQLSWSTVPGGTGALALVVDDPDAGGFVHWIVLDLAASSDGSLPEGVSGTSAAPQEGTNDFGRVGWNGPCPPSGEHHYQFTLLAMAAPLALAGAPGGREVRDALDRSTILVTAVLEATYSRP